ncbi:spore coat protein [Paenibacillus sp. SYP-B3998]|uniref:Spore coat protein n=1 Tax=Paenibacillus sp. SYP-B3998 TaxID=2678564 RepID=A0A6G4A2S1_9BACL|nr:spore coat protein [Paenibacillus sp. SYP-B3998]
MYQQSQQNQRNSYQQQAYGNQQHQQSQQQQVYLEEQDLANFVLSELKRTAREYTTAILEAANPQVRQTFQTLLQKTLQDQSAVFQEIQSLGGYEIQPAAQQQLQQELQKQSQSSVKLQSFVQQNLSRVNKGHSQQQVNQTQAQHQQTQSPSQNQIAALHQAPFQPAQTINATSFPNAVYNQGFSQHTSNSPNTHQQQPYNVLQDQGYSPNQGYSTSDYGVGGISSGGIENKSAYNTTDLTSSEITSLTGKSANQTQNARNQSSDQSSHSTGESSYLSRHQEGSRYSF